MPWKVGSEVDRRQEFVELAKVEGTNVSELCLRFGISRKTGYKWLQRYAAQGMAGLLNQSRRPQATPGRTSAELEQQVLELREAHPRWGGRKLRRRMQNQGVSAVPAASTITEILRRYGKLSVATGSIMMLPGLISRCNTPFLWA